MVHKGKSIVIDIDGTLCPVKTAHQSYDELIPFPEIVAKIKEYQVSGFYIILHSARNMKTYDGNMGLITAKTAKSTMQWLDKHQIPYDEILFGKPWCGPGGFYVDDRAIRPDEFLALEYSQIQQLTGEENTP